MKKIIKHSVKIFFLLIIICMQLNASAQIPPNAVNADPSAKSISQVPLGPNIVGTAVIKFKFTNEASSANATGQIPAGSVRLTISFPTAYAYTSVNSIPKFMVEDADTGPAGVVHLVNTAMIDEGEVVDLLLNVRGLVTSTSGTVTFNADRTTPVRVANTLTSNDNSSSSFFVTGTLPVTLTSFTASNTKCEAKLSWSTNETAIDHYDIEMSNDGSGHYNKIGTVAATGSPSNAAKYNFTYTMQNSNAHLFRLRIYNTNGTSVYSYVARINSGCSDGKDIILIYPSPAKSSFTLNVTDKKLVNTNAFIFDANGKRLSAFIITANTMNVNISTLPSGLYFIKLDNGRNVKFIKE